MRTFTVPLAVALVALFLSAAEVVRSQAVFSALPEAVLAPSDNPTDTARVTLGRLLFWDPILSGNKDVACATCHHPRFGYAENLDISIGVNGVGLGGQRRFESPNSIPFVKRNSQTILNVGFNGIDQSARYNPSAAPMFWDTRVESLEKQALEPIKSFEEMRGDAYAEEKALETVVSRLETVPAYRAMFSKAFGAAQISSGNLGKALAAFQRSLTAADSPFDRYMRGDAAAMTPGQIRGMARFERAGCANCHSGPMFSDYKVHVLGVADNVKLPSPDSGVNQTYAFRTASLRNLAYTAPYMHSGVLRTLDDVLSFYNRVRGGGRRTARNDNVSRDQLDPLLRRLNVGGRRSEIVQFLSALNDDGFDKTVPDEVPSGLSPGGKIQ